MNLKLAYLYQKRAQHGLQLYPGLGYRFTMGNGLGIESGLGLGYMHAFTDLQQFRLNENWVSVVKVEGGKRVYLNSKPLY